MIAAECSYQTKLPWKMGHILQCRVNTFMFFALYWQPCLAYTEFSYGLPVSSDRYFPRNHDSP